MTAKIVSPRGDELCSLEEWAKLHRDVHWKKGRSAYTLADFVLNGEGASHLESRLSGVLEREASICLITPEKEVRFDRYGRGRFHDLAIEGVVGSDMSLFVGVEAKVDESLGPTVQERYEGAEKELLKNSRSKATERIRNLPELVSPGLELDSTLDIRYQLIHGTLGTIAARQTNGQPYDCYVFYVLVFKTFLYDEQSGEENHRDYLRFIQRLGGSIIEHPQVEAHSLTIGSKPLTCIYEHAEIPCRG